MKEKFRGCLLGGAAGDALGYTVEFVGEEYIFSKFGKRGITAYVPVKGKARISDDTQMTLFTADALLMEGEPVENIAACYRDWLVTQRQDYPWQGKAVSRLMVIPELFAPRAPGLTCMSAIEAGCVGTMEAPPNHSKGCGGVMRVAPIGLRYQPEEAALIAAKAAALTHGHPLGYIPAAMLAHMVSTLARTDKTPRQAADAALVYIRLQFADCPYLPEFLTLMEQALALSAMDGKDLEAIHALGEGWVGDEALAIAVYCALKYEHDFDSALIAAVNHKGDSDSTGAICGNILGAFLGLEGIPEKYLAGLELSGLAMRLADDLYTTSKGD